jgi:hypothetical protein
MQTQFTPLPLVLAGRQKVRLVKVTMAQIHYLVDTQQPQ